MRKLFFLFLTLLSASANAEVFKCTVKYGKTIYQNSPCQGNAKEQQLDIKSDPAKEAAAKAKLEAIRNEYDARKAAQEEKAKALSSQRNDAVSLEIARRAAVAQQEQAQAQQRQADALERQNQNDNRDYYLWPTPIPGPAPAPIPTPISPSEQGPGANLNPPLTAPKQPIPLPRRPGTEPVND